MMKSLTTIWLAIENHGFLIHLGSAEPQVGSYVAIGGLDGLTAEGMRWRPLSHS
jgi:hypothetical protein